MNTCRDCGNQWNHETDVCPVCGSGEMTFTDSDDGLVIHLFADTDSFEVFWNANQLDMSKSHAFICACGAGFEHDGIIYRFNG